MPRIWINFLEFVTAQHLITYVRHMFDAALRALPITQHHRIWPLYLKVGSGEQGEQGRERRERKKMNRGSLEI